MSNKVTLSPRRLFRVFEKQAGYLVDKKYDQLAGVNKEIFLKELGRLGTELKKFDYLRFHEGNIPLLVVISRSMLDIDLQMKKLKIGSNPGISNIGNYEKFKAPSVQGKIYLIFNVDSGRDLGSCGASTAKAALRIDGRAGLFIEEGIALARYYHNVILNKSFYLVGSMQDAPPLVPTLIYLPKSACVFLNVTKGAANRHAYIPSRDPMFDP